MGVSGSGKTTVGTLLAERIGVAFEDADDLHPQANVTKMAAGHPLTDEDRAPWLEAVAGWLHEHPDGVIACSALRRRYRDVLRGPDVLFALLDGPREVLESRVDHRQGHFMPASLLDSQLATLERPDADENAVTVDLRLTPEEQVAAIADRLPAPA